MKEVLDKTDELLLKALEGIEKASDFTIDMLPVLVQQIILWEIAHNLILFVTGIIALIVSYKLITKAEYNDEFRFVVGFISGIYGLVATLLGTGFLKPLLVPDLFLLEYASNLVK